MPSPSTSHPRPLLMLVAFSMVTSLFVSMASLTPASAAVTTNCSRGTNLSFEQPVIPDTWRPVHEDDVPGWETHASDGMLEIWVDGFLGVSATNGDQISELQANGTSPIYQDIPSAEGDVITWSVDHKGRAATDTATVKIGAPGTETTVQTMVTSASAWATYTGAYTVPSGQTTTRFMLDPIGSGSVGNLIDNIVIALTCGLDATTSSVSVADTDGSGTDSAGDIATVTISVTNTGTATLLAVDVSDAGADSTVCAAATLKPGETTTCVTTHALDQADIDAGAFSGSAAVGGHDAANVDLLDGATYSTPLLQSASFDTDLDGAVDVSVTGPAARADTGDTVTYTGTVTNTGNVTVSSVAVAIDVAGALVCLATTLVPGESTTCTAIHTITQGDIDNGAINAIGSFSAVGADSTDLTSTDTADVVLDRISDLAVDFAASASQYDAVGTTIDLTIGVTNVGNTSLTDIEVTHDLPSGATLDCGVTPFGLAPGETRSCTALETIVQGDIDAGQITGSATATGTDPSDDAVAQTSDLLILTADQQPSLTLGTTSTLDLAVVLPSDRADAGDGATVTYTIENSGNVTLSGLSLAGALGSPISCPATELAPTDVVVCIADADVSQADIDLGIIDAAATAEAAAPDSSAVSANDDHMVAVDREPAIAVTETIKDVTSHGDGTYTVVVDVTVSNTGNTTLTAMDVDDDLATAFPNATVTPTVPFPTAAELLPGTSVSATYTVVVNAEGIPGPYDTLSVASASSPVGDVSATASAQVTLDVGYDLVVTVDSPVSAGPGTSHAQVLTVSNLGPAAAFGPIVATVTLDPSASFESFSGDVWDCSVAGAVVTCVLDSTLNAGASSVVTIVSVIDADLGDVLDFNMSVTSGGAESDIDQGNNVLAVQLTVEELPVTGLTSDLVALIGVLLLLAGIAVVLATRWESDDDANEA